MNISIHNDVISYETTLFISICNLRFSLNLLDVLRHIHVSTSRCIWHSAHGRKVEEAELYLRRGVAYFFKTTANLSSNPSCHDFFPTLPVSFYYQLSHDSGSQDELTMYPSLPLSPWEKDLGQRKGGAEPILILPGIVASALWSPQVETQDRKLGDLYTFPLPFAHRDIPLFSYHYLFTVVEVWVVLPAVPDLVLVGEAAVKSGSSVVPDIGLDVFCYVANS